MLHIVKEHYALYAWASSFVFTSFAYTYFLLSFNVMNEFSLQSDHQRINIAAAFSDGILESSLIYTEQKKPIAGNILYSQHIYKSRESFTQEINQVLSLADAKNFDQLAGLSLKNDRNGLDCYINYIKGLYDDGDQELASKRLSVLPPSLRQLPAVEQIIKNW